MSLLATKGNQFEQAELQKFKADKSLKVTEFERNADFNISHQKTIEALNSVAGVSYQTALQLDLSGAMQTF